MKRKVILGVVIALLMVLTSSFPGAAAPAVTLTVGSFVYNAAYNATSDTFGAYNISWQNVHPYVVILYVVRNDTSISGVVYPPKGAAGKYPQNVGVETWTDSRPELAGINCTVHVMLLNRKWQVLASTFITNITWGTDKTWPPT